MRTTPVATVLLSLALACGDDVAATATTGSTSTGTSGTSTGEPPTPTTGTPTTTDASSSTSGASLGGSSSSGEPDPTTGTSTGSSSTGEIDATTSSSSSSSSGDGTTGTTDTSTGDSSSSTSDASSSSGSSSTTDDSTTGDIDVPLIGYVAMSSNNSLVRLDLETATALLPGVSLLPHASYPYDLKIKPDGSEAWVVGAIGDGVKVIDTTTGLVTQSIDLKGIGEYAVDVLFNADGTRAYVSSRDSKALVVIDTATYLVESSIPLGGNFEGGKMALDPCSGRIFMVDWFDKSLLVIEPEIDKVTPFLIGTSLWDLQYDPVDQRLYVLDRGPDTVLVLNAVTFAQIASVPVGSDPWGVDLTADGGLLVVACEDAHSVYFIDTSTLINNNLLLPADADPRDVSIHPDDTRAYVPTGDVVGEDGVYELDLLTETLTNTILVGAGNSNSNIVAVRPQNVTCP